MRCRNRFPNSVYPTLFLPQNLSKKILDDSLVADGYKTLMSQSNELNSRMVVIDWDHLRCIDEVTVIAWGSFKREALWTLLLADCVSEPNEPSASYKSLVYELWTDAETAWALVNAWNGLADRPDGEKLWDWYVKMSKDLFVSTSTALSVSGRQL